VEIPGLAWAKFFIVPADGLSKVVLPKAVELEGEDDLEKKGVHLLASAPVAVYGLNHMDYSTDSFLGLPMPCLGTEYLVLTYQNVHDNVPLLHGTELAVVSPQDKTTVEITPADTVGSHPAGVPFAIVLDRGDTYQLRNETGQPAIMSGTRIRSDKPVGVFGAHRCANIASATQFFCDFIVEEMLPVSLWGTSYYVAPLMTRDGDTVRVLAAQDGTPVMVNGAVKAVLNAGEIYEFILQNPGPGAQGARISSDFPLLVAHYSNSSDYDNVFHADPFMALIQPYGSWFDDYMFCAPPTTGFPDSYLNVVATSSGNLSLVRLDGNVVTTLPGAVVGAFDNGFVYARARIPATFSGAHQVTSRSPIALTAYGYAEFDSFGCPGGMRFQDGQAPVVICPEEIVIRCDEPTFQCTASMPDLAELSEYYDDCVPSGDLGVNQDPPAGSRLGPGTYNAVLTVFDGNANQSQCTTRVIVRETWEVENFGLAVVLNPDLEATVWGETADPDRDGLVNGGEKKIDSDPNEPTDPLAGVTILVDDADSPGRYLKVIVRRPVLAAPGACFLEGSRDLHTWLAGADIFEELVTETRTLPGGEYEEVSFRARETIGMPLDRYFVRYQADP
jgi:hypothetical protein